MRQCVTASIAAARCHAARLSTPRPPVPSAARRDLDAGLDARPALATLGHTPTPLYSWSRGCLRSRQPDAERFIRDAGARGTREADASSTVPRAAFHAIGGGPMLRSTFVGTKTAGCHVALQDKSVQYGTVPRVVTQYCTCTCNPHLVLLLRKGQLLVNARVH